jgi:hypothetical protein
MQTSMKTTKIVCGILALFLSTTMATQAQKAKSFSGVITYTITYPDSSKLDASVMAALPVEMTTYIMGDMRKNVITSPMTNQVEILDAAAGTRTALIDIMGQKLSIISSKEEMEKEAAERPAPVITYLDTTKIIAGYPCKKALMVITGKEGKTMNMEVYYTREITGVNLNLGSFQGLDGFPLEFSTKQGPVTMMFTATTVKRSKVKKNVFDVPEGYKQVTEEELRNMFGGGNDM